MAVPTHRLGCQTRTFETRCLDCHQRVFFFSCTCESKVFFDKKGPPWPLHRERCIPYLIRVLRDETGISDKGILERVKDFATARHLVVPAGIYKQLSDGSYPPHLKLQVMNIPPYDERIIVEGVILDLNSNINFFKKFDLRDNAIGHTVLGNLATGTWSELTVRQMHNELEYFAYQFTFYMPQDFVNKRSWRQGISIAVQLNYVHPVGRSAVWVFDNIAD